MTIVKKNEKKERKKRGKQRKGQEKGDKEKVKRIESHNEAWEKEKKLRKG